jgi:hypothetical protein
MLPLRYPHLPPTRSDGPARNPLPSKEYHAGSFGSGILYRPEDETHRGAGTRRSATPAAAGSAAIVVALLEHGVVEWSSNG